MKRPFLAGLLFLFLISHGLGEPRLFTDLIAVANELDKMDTEDPGRAEHHTKVTSLKFAKVLVNVDDFGAKGNGVIDDTQAFREAWNKSCTAENSVFLVPQGGRYLINATRFSGPCAVDMIIQIEGTMVAPDDPHKWDKQNPRTWILFHNLTGASIIGSGTIEGSGSKWWAESCKRNRSNPCVGAPTALTIAFSSSIRVSGIRIQNSQQMHFVIMNSQLIRVSTVEIKSPSDSPNTDGIHITGSTDVVVEKTQISTGDDCLSIVNGSSNIRMKNIECGPGHGISIGSLGKDNTTGVVSNVVLSRATISGTSNGIRIKTWQGGSGYVTGALYQKVKMMNVTNPILIDQNYCDSPIPCKKQKSGVNISRIMYRDIWGTTESTLAIKFDCSDDVPCTGIHLSNVCLQKDDGEVETYCHSATGTTRDYMQPSADCLTSFDESSLRESHDLPHDEL